MVKAADPRAQRFAKNESFCREVNERINRLSDALPRGGIRLRGGSGASGVVSRLAAALEVEEIVTEHQGYWVVRKRGVAAELAGQLDPRS